MKTIKLSRGMQTVCDDEDFSALSQFKYYAHLSKGGRVYAARKVRTGVKNGRSTYTARYLHHDIMGNFTGKVVDHIDGDPLNNRRENLRVCSQSQNIMNSRHGQSPGVFKCDLTGRFAARTSLEGKRIFLGRHDTFEEAAAVVRAFRVAHFPAHKPTDKRRKGNKSND